MIVGRIVLPMWRERRYLQGMKKYRKYKIFSIGNTGFALVGSDDLEVKIYPCVHRTGTGVYENRWVIMIDEIEGGRRESFYSSSSGENLKQQLTSKQWRAIRAIARDFPLKSISYSEKSLSIELKRSGMNPEEAVQILQSSKVFVRTLLDS